MTMDLGALVLEKNSGHGIRCTKCDALRAPLLRLESDPHAYCENCFVVAGQMTLRLRRRRRHRSLGKEAHRLMLVADGLEIATIL
jgi:uncharacterized paraquat-inducible protein A